MGEQHELFTRVSWEKMFRAITTEKLDKFGRKQKSINSKSLAIPKQGKFKIMPRHMTIKLTKSKKKIAKEKWYLTYKEMLTL